MKGPRIPSPLLVLVGTLCVSACSTPGEAPPEPRNLIRESAPAFEPPRAASAPLPTRMRGRAPADEAETWSAQGLYVGVQGSLVGVTGGDFDDEVLIGPTDAILVPDLDEGQGFGAFLAYRFVKWELGVGYSIIEHDGESTNFSGGDADTEFRYLDLFVKRYYWASTAIQPYLYAGMGWSRAIVSEGTTDGLLVDNAELEDGITINLGAGVSFFPLPFLNVFGQGIYRFAEFKATDGIDGKLSGSDIDADAWEVSVGASIRLLPGRN